MIPVQSAASSETTKERRANFPLSLSEQGKSSLLPYYNAYLLSPTRRVKSISKLFCIGNLIRRGFI